MTAPSLFHSPSARVDGPIDAARPVALRRVDSGHWPIYSRGTLRFGLFLDVVTFIALFSGPPKFRDRPPLASLAGEIDGIVLLHLAVWGWGAAWVLFRAWSPLSRGILPRLVPVYRWVLVLVLLLAASAMVSPGPLLTIYGTAQMAVMAMFLPMFLERHGPERTWRLLFAGLLLVAIAIFAAMFLAPELVTRSGGRVRGDLIGPAGATAVLGLVLCVANVGRAPRSLLIVGFSCFSTLLWLAQTRASFAAFALFVALAAVFGMRHYAARLVPAALLVLAAAGAFDVLPSVRQHVVRDEVSLSTLSDRLPLWAHLSTAVAMESPVLGFGFYAGSRQLSMDYNRGLGNAHSSFMEVLVGGGVFAAIAFVMIWATLLSRAALMLFRPTPAAIAFTGLLLVVLVHSVTGIEAVQSGPVSFTLWLLIAVTARESAPRVVARVNHLRPTRLASSAR